MDSATLNLLLLAVLVGFALSGFCRGLILGVYDLLALAVILAVAVSENQAVGSLVAQRLGLPAVAAPLLGYLGILVAGELLRSLGSVLIQAILAPLFAGFSLLRYLDRLGGAGTGLLRGVAFLAIGLGVIQSVGLAPGLVAAVAGTSVGQVLQSASARLPLLPVLAEEGLVSASNTGPRAEGAASDATVPRAPNAAVSPSDEAAILAMTNLARTQEGLPSLAVDGRLLDLARQHSLEMAQQGYFAHDSPTEGSPAQRLNAAGIRYGASGENIAFAPTIEDAFRGLMASPEHRQNILSSSFRRVGIGVARADPWGVLVTEDFTDRS